MGKTGENNSSIIVLLQGLTELVCKVLGIVPTME